MQTTMRTWKQYYTVLSGPELCFYEDRKDLQQVNIFIFVYYHAFPAHINANEVIAITVNICVCLIFHRKTTCIQADFWVHFYFIKFLLFLPVILYSETASPIDKSGSLWSKMDENAGFYGVKWMQK